jgi:L-histidine Nalpha-methyltransferase
MVALADGVEVEVHLRPDDLARELRDDVRHALTSTPKALSPKWLYDARGSELFDQITRLPEYYPTRTERSILAVRAAEIAATTGADTVVELGSGTSEKTRLLLDAFAAQGSLRRFVPFDVAHDTLCDAAMAVALDYPGVAVTAIVGDFEKHIEYVPAAGRRMIAFLGSTIGNLEPGPRAQFLADLAVNMAPGDTFLLGTDLVKDRDRLIAAYDDAAGVTADFNRNVLHVINRELRANFVPDRFAHVAIYDDEHEWIEMRLRARGAQHVRVEALDLDVDFADGEDLRTEISAKFRPSRICDELEAAGLRLQNLWTDPAGDFALTLSRR